nr:unnamed protein product [Callosobruchus chinensis]
MNPNDKLNIILYSDGCGAQNRNSTLSNALLNFSVENDVYGSIEYKIRHSDEFQTLPVRFKKCSAIPMETMSRDKFEYIMTHIHFSDNLNLDESDKFAKLRPIFDHLNKCFLKYASPEEYHSVDEAMVPYNGRHGCKQYIHGKPIRYGFKLWVGTTRLGYINWFVPYQGASTYVNEAYKLFGVGASVVLSYADHLKSKWEDLKFHFFFDNFFTDLRRERHLRDRNDSGKSNSNVCFTGYANMKKEKRGKFDYAKVQGRNIIFVKWNDNNIVCFASTKGGIEPVNPVKRYSQKEKKFVYILVDQPYLVKLYNKNMGGVDRSDQNIAQYRVQIRGKNGIKLDINENTTPYDVFKHVWTDDIEELLLKCSNMYGDKLSKSNRPKQKNCRSKNFPEIKKEELDRFIGLTC